MLTRYTTPRSLYIGCCRGLLNYVCFIVLNITHVSRLCFSTLFSVLAFWLFFEQYISDSLFMQLHSRIVSRVSLNFVVLSDLASIYK